ncbi:Cytochrome P450 4G49, partial [Operophtera brumata]
MTSFVDDTQSFHFSSRLIVYPLLLLTSGLWALHRWQQKSKLYKMGEKIPGPSTVPFFGNALLVFQKKPHEIVNLALGYAEKFGSVVRVWLGTKLVIFLTEPDDVEVILNSNVHIDKSTEYKFFKPRNVVQKMKPEIGKTFDCHDYMSGVTVDILL